MGEGGSGGGNDQRRHQQAHREPETSHGGSPQSRGLSELQHGEGENDNPEYEQRHEARPEVAEATPLSTIARTMRRKYVRGMMADRYCAAIGIPFDGEE